MNDDLRVQYENYPYPPRNPEEEVRFLTQALRPLLSVLFELVPGFASATRQAMGMTLEQARQAEARSDGGYNSWI